MRSGLRNALLVVAGLLALGLASGSRLYVTYGYFGRPIPWVDALGSGLMDWLLWGPLVPPMIWLGRRFPFERRRWITPLVVHAVSAAIVSTLQTVGYAAASAWVRRTSFGLDAFAREFGSGFMVKFHAGVFVYWAVVLAVQGLESRRRMRVEELRAARLDQRLAEARTAALTARLRPHFLFNTLNAVASLIREDPDAAERVLARLGDLLRMILEEPERQDVAVRKEVEFLEGYLAIQQLRFGDRLRVALDVESELLDARVPRLVLQPIVENCIRHGIEGPSGATAIEVSVQRLGAGLRIEVSDDGPGLGADTDRVFERGLGLSSTRDRLQLLYGDDHRLELTSVDGGGTRVTMELPVVEELS